MFPFVLPLCTLGAHVTNLSLILRVTQIGLFHMTLVKYPAITTKLRHKYHEFGVTEHTASAVSRRPGGKTRQV